MWKREEEEEEESKRGKRNHPLSLYPVLLSEDAPAPSCIPEEL